MTAKPFRVDWYPLISFADFCQLKADEIGVLMQIINLIYAHNGPIENDPKNIGKSANLTRAKTERIINELLRKNHIFLTEDGKIMKKKCAEELDAVRKRREIASKNGQKGSKTKWGNEQNQDDGDGEPIRDAIASINNNSVFNKSIDIREAYDIDNRLDDDARKRAREAAPGWDQYVLMERYNEAIRNGRFDLPYDPNKAYPAWCADYTKGKPPR